MSEARSFPKPEIMSPAGHWPQLHAAIEAGADAVYFGLKHFTARAKAGFSLEELPEALRTLHRRGVKGYITFNTLVFEHELREATRAISAIAEAGADALIVQDAGVVKLARQIAPDIEIHGSTQMSITSAEGVNLAVELGVNRVTLARELSFDEIRAIRARTACDLEMFVHGALCVAYSGQCFSSEAWGGRSANRGQCAQACRLPYDLIVDGHPEPLGDARYLLSPGDLYTLEHIPEIVGLGVSTLKIEGRYKDAGYVALTTKAYRDAVDAAWSGHPAVVAAAEKLQLEQIYSRGLAPHFVTGTNHQTVVEGRAPRHRGLWMGSVVRVTAGAVTIEPSPAHRISALKPGDGVVFDAADWRSPEEPEEGGRVFEVAQAGDAIEVRFANNALNARRIRPGDRVWRTHDPGLDKIVRPYLEAKTPVHKQSVDVRVQAHEGEPLVTEWTVGRHRVTVGSSGNLESAQSRSLSAAVLRDQFGRLGNTPYQLGELHVDIEGQPFAPVSVLNQVRRDAIEKLTALQDQNRGLTVRAMEPGPVLKRQAEAASPQLHLLVRTPDQLQAAIEEHPASITLDYLDLYGLLPSVEKIKASGIPVRVASPRILKPGEERIVAFLQRLDCPILVRSTGLLQTLRAAAHPSLTGDFSLNVANSITADTFLDLGLERLTPTHDLNAAQITELASRVGPGVLEAIAYQHLPVFHTEHCVFCRFLSTGTSYKDCGRPCEKHRLEVRDVGGRSHPVIADIGCRNSVFGAEAQEASAHLQGWLDAGIRHFRLEFAHESASEVGRVTKAFQAFLDGGISARQLTQELQKFAPQGTTEGSLFIPKDYLSLPILQ